LAQKAVPKLPRLFSSKTQRNSVDERRQKQLEGRAGNRAPEVGMAGSRSGARHWLAGYGTSLTLHLLVTAGLSLLIIDQLVDRSPLSTEWGRSDERPPSLPESVGVVLDAQTQRNDMQEKRPTRVAVESDRSDVLEEQLTESILASVSKDQAGAGDGGLLKAPDGARVVRKGSFSAWTVPVDPLPEMAYTIVIQVRLPDGVRRYRARDLSGEVEGSDKYHQTIPWDRRWPNVTLTIRKGKAVPVIRKADSLPVRNRIAQILIRVPPAKKLVRDRIRIQSRMLKEEQVLEIVF
jgi:hypothetical protein